MGKKPPAPRGPTRSAASTERLDKVVAAARKAQDERLKGYREQSLRLHPWVCGRCGREFARENLHLLTVHHKDHDHDNNPPDGSNWENLCIYCHDNEHARYLDHLSGAGGTVGGTRQDLPGAIHRPFEGLKDLLKRK